MVIKSVTTMDQPKIERVLRLMKLMAGGINYTVEELADKLQTSPRSIYRYIETFKDAGFVVQKLEGGVYKLGKESRYFKEISQLIHFTDEEAHIVNQLIESLDNTNMLKQNLRRKLSSIYNCTSLADSVVKGKNATNVNALIEAINEHRQVVLQRYASSHTGVVRDRRVEPFGFTTNYVQVWCYDTEDSKTKLFNIARIGSVEVLEREWENEAHHEEVYLDVFRTSGNRLTAVTLDLGLLSRNLLIEEYPLAERDLTPLGDGRWQLKTEVCNYAGVGRFVMGLLDDIRIIDSPDFQAYIEKKIEEGRLRIVRS